MIDVVCSRQSLHGLALADFCEQFESTPLQHSSQRVVPGFLFCIDLMNRNGGCSWKEKKQDSNKNLRVTYGYLKQR